MTRIRIIVVNDSNSSAVKFLISYIRYHLTKDAHCLVRIFDEKIVEEKDSSTLSKYLQRVQLWRKVCEFVHIIRASSTFELSAFTTLRSHIISTIFFDDLWSKNIECVYLISFSSLAITLKIASRISIANACISDDHWRWLMNHWEETWRSNIIINV